VNVVMIKKRRKVIKIMMLSDRWQTLIKADGFM
jgi:hypothetical protein